MPQNTHTDMNDLQESSNSWTTETSSYYKKMSLYSFHCYYYSYIREERHSLFYSRKLALNAFFS